MSTRPEEMAQLAVLPVPETLYVAVAPVSVTGAPRVTPDWVRMNDVAGLQLRLVTLREIVTVRAAGQAEREYKDELVPESESPES